MINRRNFLGPVQPTAAETLLDNIAKLFQLQVSPQQGVDAMNGVIGK